MIGIDCARNALSILRLIPLRNPQREVAEVVQTQNSIPTIFGIEYLFRFKILQGAVLGCEVGLPTWFKRRGVRREIDDAIPNVSGPQFTFQLTFLYHKNVGANQWRAYTFATFFILPSQ